MYRDHQRDLLAPRIVALSALEIRADGRRPTSRFPGILGEQAAEYRRAFARDVPEPILIARLVAGTTTNQFARAATAILLGVMLTLSSVWSTWSAESGIPTRSRS
jgi:hypothetical protein